MGDIVSLIKVKGQDQNVNVHYTMSYHMKAPVMIFLGAGMSSIEIRIWIKSIAVKCKENLKFQNAVSAINEHRKVKFVMRPSKLAKCC